LNGRFRRNPADNANCLHFEPSVIISQNIS
jgi:hypothetical protein